jgi:mono/diheme cytochrome c family protein
VGILILVLAAFFVVDRIRTPRPSAAQRGHALAQELGCHGCHGPGGTGGVPNPGSDEKEVPAWDGGTAMMYVESEEEIREWILDGAPQRLRESSPEPDRGPFDLPLSMPSYREVVSDAELEDLVAYYKAVSNYGNMPDSARAGYRVARRLGCFGCHGPAGLVGQRNPGSFKGYIPPWHGRDFGDLVRDDDELRGWILDGGIGRLEDNAIARFFTNRQKIQMPAYRDALAEGDLDALVAYIRWTAAR